MSRLPNAGSAVPRPPRTWVFTMIDLLVTLLLWGYFTVGFVILFSPFYALASIPVFDRTRAFQWFNHLFYRGFFGLCRLTMPRQNWRIDPAIASIRSSVVVCNHASYIDPLLLISLFARHTTIVKNRLFSIPIFGRMLTLSGYLPSDFQGPLAGRMIERLDRMPAFLDTGANLFVFPEGTRSRNRTLGTFNPGAFKIARLCRAPLAVVRIENSDRLFTPGRFLFNTCQANTISVRLLTQMTPDYDSAQFSIKELIDHVRALLETAAEPDPAQEGATTRPDAG